MLSEDMISDRMSNQFPSLLREYTPDNIFNADETGLFWKSLPHKMASVQDEQKSALP